MSLEVLQIGADAAWRSAPLTGWKQFGVPEGGPFDRESWAWCCALAQTDRAIEVGPFGGRFRARSRISVAVAGALRPVRIDGEERGNGRHTLEGGQVLELDHPTLGARSYVAVSSMLRSTASLQDEIVTRGQQFDGRELPPFRLGTPPSSLRKGPIRVTEGPQSDQFRLDQFLSVEWIAALAADRTGIRLDGPEVTIRTAWGDRPSEPQTVGTIQITGGGTPIVIGPDGPTIGGYPKVAVVIGADRDRLGQLKPGDRLRFERIELDEARALWLADDRRRRDTLAARP